MCPLSDANNELLSIEAAAQYLGLKPAIIQQWCRDGASPSLRIGRSWCIRRSVVEEPLLGRDKRSQKLVVRLGSFLEIPDNLLMIAQNQQLMRELNVGFLKVADARGGTLTKYYDDNMNPVDELRSYLGPTLSFPAESPGARVLPLAV